MRYSAPVIGGAAAASARSCSRGGKGPSPPPRPKVASGAVQRDLPSSYRRLAVPEARLASAEARERGRQLFLSHCALCHGSRADGRGVRSEGLARSPADFTDPHWRRRTTPRRAFFASARACVGRRCRAGDRSTKRTRGTSWPTSCPWRARAPIAQSERLIAVLAGNSFALRPLSALRDPLGLGLLPAQPNVRRRT